MRTGVLIHHQVYSITFKNTKAGSVSPVAVGTSQRDASRMAYWDTADYSHRAC